MSTQTLPADNYIYFEFRFRRRGVIKFYVEAEFPIDTYVVDSQGFNDFQSGHGYDIYGGFAGQVEHRQELKVPFDGDWYLVIKNPRPESVAVHYEVR